GGEAEVVLVRLGSHDWSGAAIGQRLKLGDQSGRAGRVDDRARAARGGDVVGQHVGGAQQGLHRRLVARLAARAQLIHQRLEDVGETDQCLETEGPGPALDRVDGAEDGVDDLDVRRAGLQRQQIAFQVGEQFLALLKEGRLDRLERIVAHRPTPLFSYAATRRTASTRRTGSNGLTIQPVAPASRARCFLAASLSVVRTSTGTALKAGSARIPSMKPKPSMRGMLMSVMTMSGLSA